MKERVKGGEGEHMLRGVEKGRREGERVEG